MKPFVGLTQRGDHVLWSVSMREQETEVAVPLGGWHHRMADRDRDPDLIHAGGLQHLFDAADPVKDPPRRDRNHHHPARQGFPGPVIDRFAQGVPEQQFLERSPGAES